MHPSQLYLLNKNKVKTLLFLYDQISIEATVLKKVE